MALVFDSIVDSGRDRDQASGRKVFFVRILVKDDTVASYVSCHTLYAYDTAPTVGQRNAIIAAFIASLNASVDADPFDDLKDDLRDIIHQAIQINGKTKAQVKTAIINALS